VPGSNERNRLIAPEPTPKPLFLFRSPRLANASWKLSSTGNTGAHLVQCKHSDGHRPADIDLIDDRIRRQLVARFGVNTLHQRI
jgi:hypothetical protein